MIWMKSIDIWLVQWKCWLQKGTMMMQWFKIKHATTTVPSKSYKNWKSQVDVVDKEVAELRVMHKAVRKKPRLFSFKKRSDFTKKLKEKSTVIFELMMEESHLVDVL